MGMWKFGMGIVALTTAIAFAKPLSEPAFFNRCYAHLTGKPVPLKHPWMQQIRAGQRRALEACLSLLDKSELTAAGPLVMPADPEARDILNQFYAFHRTWFPTNTVDQIQDYNEEMGIGTVDIFDATEPGLALTRVAFLKSAPYKEVLTLPNGVHALREENPRVRSLIGWTVNNPGRRLHGNSLGFNENLYNFRALAGNFSGESDITNSTFLHLPKIEVGELVGIRVKSETAMIPNVSLAPLGADRRGNEQPGLNFNFDLFQTFGGGVLGTPIYFMMNYGHGLGLESNGSTKVPRRWSQTNMNSFLCANLPTLRELDVKQYLVGNSSAPFRNGVTCLQCHATLDPMAYTARNLILANSDYFRMQTGGRTHSKTTLMATSYKPEMSSVNGWPSEPVTDFHRQSPQGRLYFRSMTGELIDRPVSGIAALGQAMTETKDFYYCAAKRYFEFFTGIQVPLFDRSNPVNADLNRSLSPEAKKDRAFIEMLGDELQKHQSLRELMKRILSSSYYRNLNFRD